MSEYLAPGVYVQDGDFDKKPIEGVSTSTAGFIGPTRTGPRAGLPEMLTSFADFERIYGGLEPLDFEDVVAPTPNDVAHAVRGFFDEGGRRAYVARIFRPGDGDGKRPTAAEYEGGEGPSGLRAFEELQDISTVAAPGSTRDMGSADDRQIAAAVMQLLISHCERMRYRIAVLDSINGQSLTDVRELREGLDTTCAALYYPWVRIRDPLSGEEILQPPSGFVAGIYARNDAERGIHKAPANEVVRSACGLEFPLNKAEQEVLNPGGINCLRFFEGRGYRVWGARTLTSDPEWKYVNVRRYVSFLERSIDRGLQWTASEPNDEALWAKVKQAIERFLYDEFSSSRLMGTRPEEAYFVRCDRTTMTQKDLDSGRLICLVGVAVLRPAEFAILRVGQWTADAAGDA